MRTEKKSERFMFHAHLHCAVILHIVYSTMLGHQMMTYLGPEAKSKTPWRFKSKLFRHCSSQCKQYMTAEQTALSTLAYHDSKWRACLFFTQRAIVSCVYTRLFKGFFLHSAGVQWMVIGSPSVTVHWTPAPAGISVEVIKAYLIGNKGPGFPFK